MGKNFKSPLEIYDNLNFKFKERSELEERLNNFYGSKEKIPELSLEQQIYESNTFGSLFSFLPCRIYTFDYVYMNNKRGKAIDYRPMVLVKEDYIKEDDYRVKGFNLNFLPRIHVVQLIELYTKFFNYELDRDIDAINEGRLNITRYTDNSVDKFFSLVERYLPKVFNSTRVWSKSQISTKSVKFIKLQDYDKIFEYSGFTRTIKGKHWRTIQGETVN